MCCSVRIAAGVGCRPTRRGCRCSGARRRTHDVAQRRGLAAPVAGFAQAARYRPGAVPMTAAVGQCRNTGSARRARPTDIRGFMNVNCVECGACCASFRVDFHPSDGEAQGGRVPEGLYDELNVSIARMRGTDATARRSARPAWIDRPHARHRPCSATLSRAARVHRRAGELFHLRRAARSVPRIRSGVGRLFASAAPAWLAGIVLTPTGFPERPIPPVDRRAWFWGSELGTVAREEGQPTTSGSGSMWTPKRSRTLACMSAASFINWSAVAWP